MGTYKQWLIEQEELADQEEPNAIDWETKRSFNAKPKKTIIKPKKKIKKTLVKTNSEPVPMSKNRLFDNSDAWLDDEPWRKW